MATANTATPETALAKAEPQAVTPAYRPPTKFGALIGGFDEAWRMACAIAKSDLAPKDFKGKPENTFIAMQMGAEVGLSPMASIQNIAVINGRPAIWGDSLLALVMTHPEYESIKEVQEGAGDARVAVCTVKRKGHEPHVTRFGVADAKQASLWTKDGVWKNYPERMLKMRARAFACRDMFPDALRGLGVVEELRDAGAGVIEGDAIVSTPALPAEIKRASELAAAPAATQEAPAPADDISPPIGSGPYTFDPEEPLASVFSKLLKQANATGKTQRADRGHGEIRVYPETSTDNQNKNSASYKSEEQFDQQGGERDGAGDSLFFEE